MGHVNRASEPRGLQRNHKTLLPISAIAPAVLGEESSFKRVLERYAHVMDATAKKARVVQQEKRIAMAIPELFFA